MSKKLKKSNREDKKPKAKKAAVAPTQATAAPTKGLLASIGAPKKKG